MLVYSVDKAKEITCFWPKRDKFWPLFLTDKGGGYLWICVVSGYGRGSHHSFVQHIIYYILFFFNLQI